MSDPQDVTKQVAQVLGEHEPDVGYDRLEQEEWVVCECGASSRGTW